MSRATNLFQNRDRTVFAPTVNRDGYPAFVRSIEEQYVQTLVANTFGNTFYASEKDMIREAEHVHDAMLKKDTAFAAKALVYARQKGYMRTQPIYGLAKLFAADGEQAERIFGLVIRTPNDLRDFAVMIAALRNGSQGGRRIKRAVGNWLVQRMSEYWAIKYGSAEKKGYSLKEMLCAFHPNARGASLTLFDWIMERADFLTKGGKIKKAFEAELPQIAAFERLKRATTTEEKVKAITEGKLPHEVTTSFAGSDKDVWMAIFPQLPIFALLRNLATLERHGVMGVFRHPIIKKLTDENTIRKSMILPFRFMEAMPHVKDPHVRDALRDALEISLGNIPAITGRTVVAVDISGSMGPGFGWHSQDQKGAPTGGYIRVASLFGVALMKKADLNGRMFLFDTQLDEFKVSMRDSTLTQADRIRTRGGTDTSLPIRKLLQDRDAVDNFIIITDEQQNTGSQFLRVLDQYRRSVNKDVKAFIVDVAPYRQAMSPDTAKDQTYFIYGWSDKVLNFISLATEGWGDMVDVIRSGKALEGFSDKPTPKVEEKPKARAKRAVRKPPVKRTVKAKVTKTKAKAKAKR